MRQTGLSNLTRITLLMAAYVVAGLAGNYCKFDSQQIVLVWPAYGIGLAAIILFGYRFWPGVALGAILFSVIHGELSVPLIASTAMGSTLGAIVCAFLLQRFTEFKSSLERVRDVASFTALACALGTTVNAAFNAAGLLISGAIESEQLLEVLVSWWVPNAMAGLIITPLLLTMGSRSNVNWTILRMLEALICAAGLLAATLVSFRSWFVYGIQNYPLAYLPYPFLVWASLRFGPRGAAGGTFVVSLLAILSLIDQRGPFVASTERDSLMLVGSYLGVLSITNLLLAAAALERELAERAVRASERRYRAVVEDQTDLIARFDADGKITFVNTAYCRFYSKDRNELTGTYFLSGIPESDREIPLLHLSQLTIENPVVSFDFKVNRTRMEFVWHQTTIRRLFDEEGQTLEFQSVTQDITRRKQAEEAIRNAEERLRLILLSMVDGVVVTDDSGVITSCNDAAERIFGRPAHRMVGRSLDALMGESGMAAVRESLQRHRQEQRHVILETEMGREDGSTILIDICASGVMLNQEKMNVVVVRNIAERRRMEEQIRQAQKMEAVGRLAGGISHDFNNIMQAIMGYTHLLQTSMDPLHPDAMAVQQIERSAEKAAELTNQLLAFSRKQIAQPRAMLLSSTVLEMQQLLQRLIGEQIQLDVHCTENETLIKADPVQMGQVILNLALNARDAMPEGGTLSISTVIEAVNEPKPGFSDEFIPGNFVVLRVSDTGTGMTTEVQQHLFEPFFTTKEVGRGTGLGLSIVYGIVRQSRGQVTVRTAPNEGTSFAIHIPIFDGTMEYVPVPIVRQPSTGGSETILVVEDSDAVRAMLVELMALEGYTIREAQNGEDALRILRGGEKIDLVLTDVVMPKLGGLEIAEAIKAIDARIPILFMSGYSPKDPIKAQAADNPAHYLQKPFRPDVLLFKIRSLLDNPEQV
ncbi:MAG TPA: MASE1 domain-containing protein [Roseimicrobium sp.]|nr:MASE1 domain-containing protein [Roseimicrobium sp.]